MKTADEFWARVAKGRGCWEWRGNVLPLGYGQVYWRGHPQVASRVAAYLMGMVPSVAAPKCRTAYGFVLHTCDNRRCCNPKHLFVGTQRDNIRDAVQKSRLKSNFRGMPGATNGRAKLTPAQVATIRQMYTAGATQMQLAARYGVVQSHISRLIRREQYR